MSYLILYLNVVCYLFSIKIKCYQHINKLLDNQQVIDKPIFVKVHGRIEVFSPNKENV